MGLFKDSGPKDSASRPVITDVAPAAAIPGGELQIRGRGLAQNGRPSVSIGDMDAHIVIGSNDLVIARVPDGASAGEVVVSVDGQRSNAGDCEVGVQIAEGVHPVASPVADREGNVFTTFSGPRGQKTPVSVYRIDLNYNVRPFVSDIMNATGLTFDADGLLYVSSRHDGIVYQVTPSGNMSVYVEGMGIATGLAFDRDGNLFVGDRSGTIFKISNSRQIYVFTTMEPSIAAYHMAFGPDGYLYVAGPTTSSYDSVYRVSPAGEVETFYRGLGRPQGLAFDTEGNAYVAASYRGRRGVVRIGQDRQPELFISGPGIVGLCFAPSKAAIIATNGAVYRAETDIQGYSAV